ncbi:MAG: PEGA domain-containing protein [Defluviitaleaceae bacterium]|nr:PEGA domain-containing protein [Defluviitaleaceae bacterium]
MARKSQDDYDGVIYEPSDYIDPKRNRSSGGRQSSSRSNASARRAAPKSQFTLFYILTLIAAVTLCIVIFLVVFNSASNRNNSGLPMPPVTGGIAPPSNAQDNDFPVAIEETTMLLGFIQDITTSDHQVRVLDIENGVVLTLTADATTALTSRYGRVMLFSEFRAGDMVDVSFTRRTNVLRSMSISSDSWEHRNVQDIRVDVVNQTLTHSNNTYRFGRGFMVRYNNEPYSIANVKPIDVVTIRGHLDTVWAVDVIRSHGTLMLVGRDEIMDGRLEIDTDMFVMLDQFEPEGRDLVEGERRLVITGSNIEPFVKLVQINPGEATTVDLADAQLRSGILRLTVNEPFYTLYIGGELTSTSEPIVLPYGTHRVRIERDGFEPWEEEIEVRSPTADLNVALQPIHRTARLLISTEPTGARIFVNEAFVGTAPATALVDQGLNTVRTEMEGYLSISIPVEVATNEHRMIIELQRTGANSDFIP